MWSWTRNEWAPGRPDRPVVVYWMIHSSSVNDTCERISRDQHSPFHSIIRTAVDAVHCLDTEAMLKVVSLPFSVLALTD